MLFEQEGLRIQQGYTRIESIKVKSSTPSGVQLQTHAGDLRISFFAPDIIRFQWGPTHRNDYGLISGDLQPQACQLESATPTSCVLLSGRLRLELQSDPLQMKLFKDDTLLLASANDRAINGELRMAPFAHRDKPGQEAWLISFELPSGEVVYGLGEKFGPLNRRGMLIENWNRDATTVNAEISYKNAPFAWSPKGWGFFINTPSKVAHGVGYPPWSHRTYVINLFDPSLDLFFIPADTPAAILEKYTAITGRAPLPPRWSYGAWMSRAYYRTAQETLEVAKKLRQRQIPCDVLVLDGRAWHRMDTRFDFSWDAQRYPDPAAFVRSLDELGFYLCVWEYPYISIRNPLFAELAEKGYLLRNPDGTTLVYRWFPEPFDKTWPHLMPSGIIDFTNPEAFEWYLQMHRSLYEIGVAAVKTDYGEAVPVEVLANNGDDGLTIHNVYALLYNRCAYEAGQRYRPHDSLVWGRAGWIGSQRYPIQWGGDPQVDWEGMAASIRGGLSWGMSGGAFYSHDIGGFAIGMPSNELYVRWAQAGIMMSHTRFHGIGPREPWEFGEQTEAIVRSWLDWRYRLVPYLEACALEASQSGLPVMRAMPLAFPDDPFSWGFEEQYLLGPSLLVAPIIQPGGRVRVYLPSGGWYNIWTGERFEGNRVLDLVEPLERLPIFGKEGTLLPLGPSAMNTRELSQKPLLEEIWLFGLPRSGFQHPNQAIGVSIHKGLHYLSGVPDSARLRAFGALEIQRDSTGYRVSFAG